MARNEEKQLARLNRFYLQKQKEEDQKKNPPRPRLDSLLTADDVKKWLPSILKDIDFYVKQMEVSCYPQRQIDEFNRRVDGLRGEYKAYLHKLRLLEPQMDSVPWTDRPYAGKRRKKAEEMPSVTPAASSPSDNISLKHSVSPKDFVPLCTPVLNKDNFYQNCFGYQKFEKPCDDISGHREQQDEPLDFNFQSQDAPPQINNVIASVGSSQNQPLEFSINFKHTPAKHEGHCTPAKDSVSCLPPTASDIDMSVHHSYNIKEVKSAWDCNSEVSNMSRQQRLSVCSSATPVQSCDSHSNVTPTSPSATGTDLPCPTPDSGETNGLNLPYSDSSSSDDENS